MDNIIDKIIIFICCTVFMIGFGVNTYTIIPVVLSIILSSLITFFDKPVVTIFCYIGYLLLSIIFPDLLFFLPLFLYELYEETYVYISLVGVFSIIYNHKHFSIIAYFLIFILCVFVFIVKKRTKDLLELKHNYIVLRDNMSESYDKLRVVNRDLLERQEYEISNATLNERNRIAREIHDSIGHIISRSLLQIGAIITISSDGPVKDGLVSVKETLSTGMDSIRESIHNLHEDSMNLEDKINEFIDEFTYCDIEFKYNVTTEFNMKAKYTIVFVVKEALANIMKHSKATHATIIISEIPAFYQILIHDNGQGSSKLLSGDTRSMGLSGFYERIGALNGNINIQNDNGFKIYITLPKEFSAKQIGGTNV